MTIKDIQVGDRVRILHPNQGEVGTVADDWVRILYPNNVIQGEVGTVAVVVRRYYAIKVDGLDFTRSGLTADELEVIA